MAGNPTNLEKGIPGGSVVLDVSFYRYNGGSLVDDDDYQASGQLPRVRILDPDGNEVEDSTDPGATQPVRVSTGKYIFTRAIGSADEISDRWKIVWTITIDGNELTFSEFFTVADPGDADFGDSEYRVGYGFGNPDTTSDHHAPGWGMLVTPDELRYIVLFGTKLVSPDASQTYDDNMLQLYIDNAIAMFERDWEFDLIPRVVRYMDPLDRITGARLPRDLPEDTGEYGYRLVREPGYPYRQNNARHYLYVKLRRRPLREVLAAKIVDPVQNDLIDLYPWRQERPGPEAVVQFVPNFVGSGTFPFYPSSMFYANYPFKDFPNAIQIDYLTGYEKAGDVPIELRDVIRWIAGIQLMEDFGDGKAPGIASASASLNSVSENYSTTQSATNALYGARITYYKEHLKQWLRNNRWKYGRNFMGVL